MAEDITKLELDPELARKLEVHADVQMGARLIAVQIADRARATAPVGDPSVDPNPGAYRDSIVVQKSNRPNSGVYRVFSNDPKASWIEFGTASHPALFIFRNAAESLGLRFVKKGEK